MSKPELRVCETCGDGRGYVWPTATDSRTDHDYVERCDICDRFADDIEAAEWLAKRLSYNGFVFDYGTVDMDFGAGLRPRPFIENVKEEANVR